MTVTGGWTPAGCLFTTAAGKRQWAVGWGRVQGGGCPPGWLARQQGGRCPHQGLDAAGGRSLRASCGRRCRRKARAPDGTCLAMGSGRYWRSMRGGSQDSAALSRAVTWEAVGVSGRSGGRQPGRGAAVGGPSVGEPEGQELCPGSNIAQ